MNEETVQKNSLKKLLNRKVILTVLGLIILAEIVWAFLSLTPKPSPKVSPAPQATPAQPTVVSLTAPQTSLKKGEKVTVAINLSSNVKTDGTDLVIIFDPKLLAVQTLAGNAPVIGGTIYSTYPQNKLETGRITVSGITTQQGGVVASGLFGHVVFQAKAPGLAKISLEFSPGSTIDSNVIESGTGKDVLERVQDLELNIVQ